jgi:hypothetical protein
MMTGRAVFALAVFAAIQVIFWLAGYFLNANK